MIAFDASTNATPGTGDLTWNHVPVGTPKGVIVGIVQYGVDRLDHVTGVTYGGVAMTEVSGSPRLAGVGTEASVVYTYFLGSSIPTGTQSVVVSTNSAISRAATCVSLTSSGGNAEIIDVDATIDGGNVGANPSITLQLGGRLCFVMVSFMSGYTSITSIAPNTGWTSRQEYDHGVGTSGHYTYNTIGSANVTAGWTQGTGEDGLMIGIAVAESPITGGVGITNTANANSTADATAYTFSAQAIGTAATDRVVVVGIAARQSGSTETISSVTIGGVTATINSQTTDTTAGMGTIAGIASAVVPTGTTGDVVVTFSSAIIRCAISVYCLTGASGTTATDTGFDNNSDPGTDTLNITAGGVAIGASYGGVTSITGLAWTNLQENNEILAFENANQCTSFAFDNFATTQTGLSISVDASPGTADTMVMAIASFEPPTASETPVKVPDVMIFS